MKHTFAAILLALTIATAAGCTHYSAIASAPENNKVFVTKTTSYIIWSSNKMLLCDFSAATAKNCTEVTED